MWWVTQGGEVVSMRVEVFGVLVMSVAMCVGLAAIAVLEYTRHGVNPFRVPRDGEAIANLLDESYDALGASPEAVRLLRRTGQLVRAERLGASAADRRWLASLVLQEADEVIRSLRAAPVIAVPRASESDIARYAVDTDDEDAVRLAIGARPMAAEVVVSQPPLLEVVR